MKPETAIRTAVEWLEYEFVKLESTVGVHSSMYHLIEQAKAMEKEQIIDAWVDGDNSDCLSEQDSSDFAEHYYNETFNTNEK